MDDLEALRPFFQKHPQYAGKSAEELARTATEDPELANALYEFSAEMEQIARDAFAEMYDVPPRPQGLLNGYKKGRF
jgi:hypothetical protein